MWSADLRLHNERSDFSVSVPSSAYQGRSFFLASRESGLRYDIQARWRESKEDKVERDSSELRRARLLQQDGAPPRAPARPTAAAPIATRNTWVTKAARRCW